ncbi:hypothetical protein Y032_0531g3035 [Ancylostoma ceylanicum]|uniref:RRM domain-containing protein n=1 Tax=Ancylostoma ceylanicum TaxID=53326 RepID=A0A016WTW1_9BILA|nr:hypothetical protein Y032_0531g3035 [Ancylostoma ceylanicum]
MATRSCTRVQVGHVVHIKMVHDRETGKPKGYGFIEFLDVQTAELAIRNLNGFVSYLSLVRLSSIQLLHLLFWQLHQLAVLLYIGGKVVGTALRK